jgi:hypothetical protein
MLQLASSLHQSSGASMSLSLPFTISGHVGRLIGNRLLLSPPTHSTPADAYVEWGYAFDVHTNAFFPLYLMLYLAQLFLLPIVLKDRWVCIWVGNTLYLAAWVSLSITRGNDFSPLSFRFAQYIYGIYLGLNGM